MKYRFTEKDEDNGLCKKQLQVMVNAHNIDVVCKLSFDFNMTKGDVVEELMRIGLDGFLRKYGGNAEADGIDVGDSVKSLVGCPRCGSSNLTTLSVSTFGSEEKECADCGYPNARPKGPEDNDGSLGHVVVQPRLVRLAWSPPASPCEEYRYNHTRSVTPFGTFLLTWKGWKEYDSPGFDETPWGEVAYNGWNTVEEAQAWAESEMERRIKECLANAEMGGQAAKDCSPDSLVEHLKRVVGKIVYESGEPIRRRWIPVTEIQEIIDMLNASDCRTELRGSAQSFVDCCYCGNDFDEGDMEYVTCPDGFDRLACSSCANNFDGFVETK